MDIHDFFTNFVMTDNKGQSGKYIGIDACNAYTGKVNYIVIEDDELVERKNENV